MNSLLFSLDCSLNSLDKLEESASISSLLNNDDEIKRKLIKSNLLKEPEESSEEEIRIIKWLNEQGVFSAIPEEKEFQYYENQRIKAQREPKTPSSEKSFRNFFDSPLLQRRKTNFPNSQFDVRSPQVKSSARKVSKFNTCKSIDVDIDIQDEDDNDTEFNDK